MITNAKKHSRLLAVAAAGLFCITLLAWNHEPVGQSGDKMYYQDTVPAHRPNASGHRDLDVQLEKLDRAIERLEQLKTRDWGNIAERVHEQLNGINVEEMTKQVEQAMKSVDMNKINTETQKALKAIDAELMQIEVNKAMDAVKIDTDEIQKAMNEIKIDFNKELEKMKDLNFEKMKDLNIEELMDLNLEEMNDINIEELTDLNLEGMNDLNIEELTDLNLEVMNDLNIEEINGLNTEKINEAMEDVKAELQKTKSALKAENYDFRKNLDDIKNDIQEAKKEISGYQDMIYSMEKEGLLDTKNDYKIANRDGSIYINDKKQTNDVSAKYGKYLKNNITIRKKNGQFNIDNNQSRID
jgi:cytochrome c556